MGKLEGFHPVIQVIDAAHRVLVFGLGDGARDGNPSCALARVLAGRTAIVTALQNPSALSAPALWRQPPDLVLAPLFGRGWDGLDLCRALIRAGYAGRLVLLTPVLPSQALVLREMQAIAPTLDILLLPLPDNA